MFDSLTPLFSRNASNFKVFYFEFKGFSGGETQNITENEYCLCNVMKIQLLLHKVQRSAKKIVAILSSSPCFLNNESNQWPFAKGSPYCQIFATWIIWPHLQKWFTDVFESEFACFFWVFLLHRSWERSNGEILKNNEKFT